MEDVGFVLANFLIFILLLAALFWFIHPMYIFSFVVGLVIKYVIPFIEYNHKKYLFVNKNRIIIDIKINVKLAKYIAILSENIVRLFIFCAKHTPEHLQTTKMQRRVAMCAVRAIDNKRIHKMVFAIERRRRDSDKKYIKKEDGSYEEMSNDEAIKCAESNGFTVVHIRGRNVRQYAEERDRMIEVHSRKGELVQKIATGTMDMNLLLSCVVNWERFLPPIGPCELCDGIVHQGEYLSYDELIKSPANKGVSGIYLNELAINHFSESQRAEVLAFIRNLGEESLGED